MNTPTLPQPGEVYAWRRFLLNPFCWLCVVVSGPNSGNFLEILLIENGKPHRLTQEHQSFFNMDGGGWVRVDP